MREPIARPLPSETPDAPPRAPRAFDASEAMPVETAAEFDAELVDPSADPQPIRRMGWLGRIAWATGGILVSLGLGLAAERLVRDLFDRYEWLGWLGLVAFALFVAALFALALREVAGLSRLRALDRMRSAATLALVEDDATGARALLHGLERHYAARTDLAAARSRLKRDLAQVFDGAEMIVLAERALMGPLDARARALTAASARRVALVTTVSPRALVDVAFVAYESILLGGAIAALYGARPGFFGAWRLAGAILGHLAVTGGLAMTDGLVEQLVGQGLAAKVSARLGEGVVNGLMTVRVGIAAMRVVRPLPFTAVPQPVVRDFLPDLANLAKR